MWGVCQKLERLNGQDGRDDRDEGTLIYFVANKDEITAEDEDIIQITGNPFKWLEEQREEFSFHVTTRELTRDSFIAYT